LGGLSPAHGYLLSDILGLNLNPDLSELKIADLLAPDALEALRRNWGYDFKKYGNPTGVCTIWRGMVSMVHEPLLVWAERSGAHTCLVNHLLGGNVAGNEEEIIARLAPDDLEALLRNWDYEFGKCGNDVAVLRTIWECMVLMAREPLRYWAARSEAHACLVNDILGVNVDWSESQVVDGLSLNDLEALRRNWGHDFEKYQDETSVREIWRGMVLMVGEPLRKWVQRSGLHAYLVKEILHINVEWNEEAIMARLGRDDLEALLRNWDYHFEHCRDEKGLGNVWKSMVLMAREPLRYWAGRSVQHTCVVRRMLPQGIDVDVPNIESYLAPSDFEILYRYWNYPFNEDHVLNVGPVCDMMYRELERENGGCVWPYSDG
jgi:hypothetical protein